MIKAPPTPKGFRDILPELAKKRRETINKIVGVLEESGFVPVETPTIEFAETLKGKYGEEEKLIYEFTDRGGRDLALRYDLTVPLARFVASNLNLIAKGPFRRYQIGQVFRGENPQKGRLREFTQLDFDSVGSSDLKEDARIIATVDKSMETLGFGKNENNRFKILLSSRNLLFKKIKESGIDDKLAISVIREIDKIKKIGWRELNKNLERIGVSKDKASTLDDLLRTVQMREDPIVVDIMTACSEMGVNNVKWDPYIARGLDYYTGSIFELQVEKRETDEEMSLDNTPYTVLSLGGGGRYDNLISMFAKRQIPAVGFSFGLDRLIDAMDDLQNK